MGYFSDDFLTWLDDHASILDSQSGTFADQLLEKIAAEGVFRIGVPESLGGAGGKKSAVIDFLAELAQHSLTAAFTAWGHRTFIENILASSNAYFRETYLDELFTGKISAGTGLSNATKYLSDIEALNVTLVKSGDGYVLEGTLPWVTNVRADHYAAIFAADFRDEPDRAPLILAVPSTAGIKRSKDLEFISLQGANTAALTFDGLPLDERWIISTDARAFLAQTRPEFLGYQFGLAFDLAQASLAEVSRSLDSNRSVLVAEYETTSAALARIQTAVVAGLDQTGDFKHSSSAFARRWNEGAFLPIVSPSAVQLRHILAAAS